MSMKLPPNSPKNIGKPFKKVSHLLALPLSSLRGNHRFCLCYDCLEIVINDTIVSTILCPGCTAVLPMRNFDLFSGAVDEAARVRARRVSASLSDEKGFQEPRGESGMGDA